MEHLEVNATLPLWRAIRDAVDHARAQGHVVKVTETAGWPMTKFIIDTTEAAMAAIADKLEMEEAKRG
jgi:hypothetical protein